MTALISALVIAGTLFLFSYITKRRFGVLGLALAAGALLSAYWASGFTAFLEGQGIALVTPPLLSVVESLLIVSPPLLLLAAGPSYSNTGPRILGALAFTVLAMTLLGDILASILVLEGPSSALFTWLHDNKSTVVVIGLIAATVDMLLAGKAKPKEDKKGKH